MKVRIKFKKFGAMKFIGHLDVMRYFQKAFRRAKIDIEYSKGYNPHQVMSFAAPLGVGLTSDSEYLDASLLSCDAPEVMIDRINAVLTEGFLVTGFHTLEETEPGKKIITAMSLVSAADYLVSLKEGYSVKETITNQDEFKEAFLNFYQREEIMIDKETKKSVQSVDIKPLITKVAFEDEQYDNKTDSVVDRYANGIKVYLQVATGSANNLKPELVMEAFYQFLGIPFHKFAWQVHRLEVYGTTENGTLLALEHFNK